MPNILIKNILLDSRILNKVRHRSIHGDGWMFAVSWALEKRDWWKDRDEPVAKFLSWQYKNESGEYIRTGIYIGRLAIVWQTRPNGLRVERNT